jgi:hypothetical protein
MKLQEMAQFLFGEGADRIVSRQKEIGTTAPDPEYAKAYGEYLELEEEQQEQVLEMGLRIIKAGGLGHKYRTLNDAAFYLDIRGMAAAGALSVSKRKH